MNQEGEAMNYWCMKKKVNYKRTITGICNRFQAWENCCRICWMPACNFPHFKLIILLIFRTATWYSLPMSITHKSMIYLCALRKLFNKPIQDYLICKKRKLRQGKRKLKSRWKEYGQRRWRCRKAMTSQMQSPLYLKNWIN